MSSSHRLNRSTEICCHRTSATKTVEATKSLETTIEGSVNRLTGRLQGLEIAVPETSSLRDEALIQNVEQQTIAIASCLKLCTTGLAKRTQSTGNTFKYARALDDARQLLGNIGNVSGGGPANTIDVLLAQDRARQMAGNIDGQVAWSFMNAPSAQDKSRGASSLELPIPEMPTGHV